MKAPSLRKAQTLWPAAIFFAALVFTNPVSGQKQDTVYDFRQLPPGQVPQFPGGSTGYAEFVSANMKYPEDALAKNIEGSVVLSFIVETDGRLSDIKVIRDIGGGCGQESERLAHRFPNFTAGNLNGVAARVRMEASVRFQKTGGGRPAQFGGGPEDLQRYFDEHFTCPEEKKGERGVDDGFVVRFVVRKDGSFKKTKVSWNDGHPCAQAAMKAVDAMPRWVAATDGGNSNMKSVVVIRFTRSSAQPNRVSFPVRMRADLHVVF